MLDRYIKKCTKIYCTFRFLIQKEKKIIKVGGGEEKRGSEAEEEKKCYSDSNTTKKFLRVSQSIKTKFKCELEQCHCQVS